MVVGFGESLGKVLGGRFRCPSLELGPHPLIVVCWEYIGTRI